MIDRFTARNRIWRPAWSFLPLWPAALVLLGGCATYHARPLSDQAVRTALAAPDFAAVKIAASKLEHPLLPPQVIDGRGGFTPDEVALMAVIVSPQLRAWRDQRGVARAQPGAACRDPEGPCRQRGFDGWRGRPDRPGQVAAADHEFSALLRAGAGKGTRVRACENSGGRLSRLNQREAIG